MCCSVVIPWEDPCPLHRIVVEPTVMRLVYREGRGNDVGHCFTLPDHFNMEDDCDA